MQMIVRNEGARREKSFGRYGEEMARSRKSEENGGSRGGLNSRPGSSRIRGSLTPRAARKQVGPLSGAGFTMPWLKGAQVVDRAHG